LNLLIDTNVISEVRRPEPDFRVVDFLDRLDEDRVFISVISLAEIRRGIALMEKGRKRDSLEVWLANDLVHRFEGRILTLDHAIAFTWGDLMGSARQRGISLSMMDGFIAATALTNGLTIATRNTKDFEGLGLSIINPWIS
jgi:predicted nucleic acid-binding protein